MKLRLLPSSFHRNAQNAALPPAQPLTSFVVEGAGGAGPLAIDAGSVGLVGEPEDMARVRGLVLTHSHIDHVASLPMWIEALLSLDRAPVRVHATQGTIEALREHLFSGPLFPDFEKLREADGRPLLEFVTILAEETFELAGFDVTAIPVEHPVPTHGLLVDDGEDAVLFGADSGPTKRLWEIAAEAPRLRAVVLETSFPDRMQAIADGAGHLTPTTLAAELNRAPADVRVLVTHMKPAYRGDVLEALGALDDGRLRVLDPGVELELGR